MSDGALTSRRTYAALGAFMAASAVADIKPMSIARRTLEAVHFPRRYWWIFPPIKAAAAIGLFSVRWFPGLARLTTAMLTLYFALAVGFHVRARDLGSSAATAGSLMATFAAMTAKGPPTRV
jgi:hypothetical protein